ncbi:MAG: type IV pilus secretin PilQ, partial [Pseudomonadota bacterium]
MAVCQRLRSYGSFVVLAFAAGLVGSPPARAGSSLLVQDIELADDGASTLVRLRCSGMPSFTVYRLERPDRIVVDLANAKLAASAPGRDGPSVVNGWVVGQFAAQEIGESESTFARVIVGLARPAAYRVNTVENEVLLLVTAHAAPPASGAGNGEESARLRSDLEQARRSAEEARLAARQAQTDLDHALAEAREARRSAEQVQAQASNLEAEARRREAEARQREAEARKTEADAKQRELDAKQREVEARQRELEAKKRQEETLELEAELKQRELDARKAEKEAAQREAQAEQREAEALREKARAERQRAESNRQKVEVERRLAEAARREAEVAQKKAEADRQQAEVERKAAEVARQVAEAERGRVAAVELEARAKQLEQTARKREKAAEQREKAAASRESELMQREARAGKQEADVRQKHADVERNKADVERQLAEAARREAVSVREKAEAERQRAEMGRERAELEQQKLEAQKQRMKIDERLGEVERRTREAERLFGEAENSREMAGKERAESERSLAEAQQQRKEAEQAAVLAAKRLAEAENGLASARAKARAAAAPLARSAVEKAERGGERGEQKRREAEAFLAQAEERRRQAEESAKTADSKRRTADEQVADADRRRLAVEEQAAEAERRQRAAEAVLAGIAKERQQAERARDRALRERELAEKAREEAVAARQREEELARAVEKKRHEEEERARLAAAARSREEAAAKVVEEARAQAEQRRREAEKALAMASESSRLAARARDEAEKRREAAEKAATAVDNLAEKGATTATIEQARARLARQNEQLQEAQAVVEKRRQELLAEEEQAKHLMAERDRASSLAKTAQNELAQARDERRVEERRIKSAAVERVVEERALEQARRVRQREEARVAKLDRGAEGGGTAITTSVDETTQRKAKTTEERKAAGNQVAMSASSRAEVRDVDYREGVSSGRVIIRLSNGAAKPRLLAESRRQAILEIPNTTIPPALERSLDTGELEGPVAAVSSFRDPSRPENVRVVVDLAKPATSKLVRAGDSWNWDFVPVERTAAKKPRASASAPGAQLDDQYPVPAASTLAATTPITAQTVAQDRRKVYRGRRIDLDFKDVDIHNLLRLFSDVGGLNIIVPDDIRASVTVRLRNVPWDQAMEVILASKGLWYRREGNLVRVAPRQQLDAEDQAEAERAMARVQMEPPAPEVFTLNYADANDMSKQVKPLLSPRGQLEVDNRTNSVIVTDLRANRELIISLMRSLDTQTPQIQIEARIVEARTTWVRQIGVQWGFGTSFSAATGNPTGLIFPSSATIAGGASDPSQPTAGLSTASPNFAVNMPAAAGLGKGGAVGFTFGSLNSNFNVALRLSAAEDSGTVRIVSAPKVTVLNNSVASINQGISIPVSVVSASGVMTTFVNADLKLEAKPQVSQRDCSIVMDVSVTKNEADFVNTGAQGDPTILRKEAKTTLLVGDGETSV